jgi:hypothetical protein
MDYGSAESSKGSRNRAVALVQAEPHISSRAEAEGACGSRFRSGLRLATLLQCGLHNQQKPERKRHRTLSCGRRCHTSL